MDTTDLSDLSTQKSMQDALLGLVATSGEVRLDTDTVRAMFSGKKHTKEWCKSHKLTVESVKGGAVFKVA